MAHIGTGWLYFGFLTVLVLTQTVESRLSKQSDIDAIAQGLKITVFLETNHLSNETYNIAFHLANGGNTPILHTDDWEIIFSMHNRNLLTRREFSVHGFVIKPYKETLYKMLSVPGYFPGLNKGQAFKITVNARGLSVFKQDIHPRFFVQSNGTVPKTILSTDDEDLRFVQLSIPGNPSDDFSKMTAMQRTMMIPDVMDYNRVPDTTVIPPPRNVSIVLPTREFPDRPLLNVSSVQLFHIWADKNVSQTFKNYFQDVFLSIPMPKTTNILFVDQEPPTYADRIYIQQTGPQPNRSPDYYRLAVRPRDERRGSFFNIIHMSATSEKGLHNAVETLKATAGLYDILPEMTIEDDARFGHRSLSLDLCKNFFGVATIKKVLKVMSKYKLNKLELILGDDYAWRLDLPDMESLSAVGAKRCAVGDCLPPYLGSGPKSAPPASGGLSLAHLSDIVKEAAAMHIEVIPRFNFLGGLLSAKTASQKEYEQILKYKKDIKAAERLYLVSELPQVNLEDLPEDTMTLEGLLDPCRNQTYAFINVVINRVHSAYKTAGVPLLALHAGGDELTQYLGLFPSCRLDLAVQTTAGALRTMIGAMQETLSSINAVLHVNEEAIVDPLTGDCITIDPLSKMTKRNLVAHFYKTFPGSPDDWNLTPEQMAYMDGEVINPNPMNPNVNPDPLNPYTGQRKGLTSWILPYRCANRGYKIVLKPENFFALDQAYEMDFEEPGNRKMRRFHIINMHRMMMYEPFNHYINMDLGKDGYTYLSYRLCKLFPCEPLTRPDNLIGLTATLDTSVIRTEKMLWHMLLPRLLCFAERAWRQGEHENILRAEEPSTLVNENNLARRSGTITMEINNLMNTLSYKDSGLLDDSGFAYRVPTLGASISLGLMLPAPPPYPLMYKADMPVQQVNVEYRDPDAKEPKWAPLFVEDPVTGMISGGFYFNFPQQNQRVEIRAVSAGGRNLTQSPRRPGRSVLLTGSLDNYLPREVPLALRNGTCLPVSAPTPMSAEFTPEEEISFDNVTSTQWKRIIQNVDSAIADEEAFRERRFTTLEAIVTEHNTRYQQNNLLPMVIQGIQVALSNRQNLSASPREYLLRKVYEMDMELYENRSVLMDNNLREMHQQYLRCRAGRAQPTILPEPRGGVGGFGGRGQPGGFGGRGQPGGVGGRGQPGGVGGRGQPGGVGGRGQPGGVGGGGGRMQQGGIGQQDRRAEMESRISVAQPGGGVQPVRAGAGAGTRGQFRGMSGAASPGRGQGAAQGRGVAGTSQFRGQAGGRGAAQRGRGPRR